MRARFYFRRPDFIRLVSEWPEKGFLTLDRSTHGRQVVKRKFEWRPTTTRKSNGLQMEERLNRLSLNGRKGEQGGATCRTRISTVSVPAAM